MKKRSMNIAVTIARGSILSIATLFLLLVGQPASAERIYTVTETIAYSDLTPGDDEDLLTFADGEDSDDAALAPKSALGRFGPFYVTDDKTAQMVGIVDAATPADFRKLVGAHPGIKTLILKECPGTEDDDANLELARMVRKAGLTTIVPKDGSVRSGGVELFLAGVKRVAEPGAEFGVHSWQDDEGREAKDYPPGAPIHMAYLNYYRDMGMTPEQAKAFYDFTNAKPFSSIHYMNRDEITKFALAN